MTIPFFSVNMLSHNRAKYLREAIEAIIAQTFTDWELIIVDDSTDPETLEVLYEYKTNPKIKIYHLPETIEMTKYRNVMLELSAGKYILYADDDDVSLPDRMQITHDELVKTDADIFVGETNEIDANGKFIKLSRKWNAEYLLNDKKETKPFCTSSVAFRTDFARDVGGFSRNWNSNGGNGNKYCELKDVGYVTGDDRDLFERMLSAGAKYHHSDKIVAYFRAHGENTTAHKTVKKQEVAKPIILPQIELTSCRHKIGIVAHNYVPFWNGAETYIHTLSLKLAACGFEVFVITNTPANGYIDSPLFKVYRDKNAEDIKEITKQEQPQILFSQFGWMQETHKISKEFDIPHCAFIHSPKDYHEYDVSISKELAFTVSVSKEISRIIKRMAGNVNELMLCPIPNEDRIKIPAEWERPADRITLINSIPEKGGLTFRHLVEELPEYKFITTGSGSTRQVKIDAPNHIHIPAGDIRKVLAETKIIFLGSTYEGFPQVGIESCFNGIPAVASDLPGIRETLGDSAIYCPVGDVNAFKRAIIMLDDPAIYQKHVELCRANTARLKQINEEQFYRFCVAVKEVIETHKPSEVLQPVKTTELPRTVIKTSGKPTALAPLFSFNVLSHNRGEFLKQALDSMLAQTLPLFEIVVADDSTDAHTRAVLNAYRDNPKVRILDFDPTKEMTWLRNAMLLMSRGKYIVYNDDDDLSEPTRLMMTRNVLEAYKADLICLGVDVIDANGKRIKQSALRPMDFCDAKGAKQRIMIHTAGAAFNREKAICAGGYDLNWNRKDNPHYPLIGGRRIGDDFDFFKRFLQAGNTYYQKNFLGAHLRRHEGNITKSVKWFDIPDKE